MGLEGRRALVVDDSDAAREILSTMLASQGIDVRTVASGEEAIEELTAAAGEGESFDLVLMDWRMPGMDGIETAERIKADAGLGDTPAILMVTAFGREQVIHRAEQVGLDGFLLKPVNESLLYDAVLGAFEQAEGTVPLPRVRDPRVASPTHLAGRRVLLVEDNLINQELASELLADLGIEVVVATNGRQGVEKATSEPFDLVLMDIQMPEMDGLTATRVIRENEALSDLPIVAMTAHAMSGDREKSLAAGMNDHLTKPIDPERLSDLLTTWMPSIATAAVSPDNREATRSAVGATTEAHHGEIEDRLATAGLPPSMRSFDLAVALARTNDKPDLLRRLLVRFGEDNAGTIARLRMLLNAAQLDEARNVAHSLKGVAGTLGAIDVASAASSLEAALARGGLDDLDARVDALETALVPAVVEATSLHGVSGEVVQRPESAPDVDQAALREEVNALRDELAAGSFGARRRFDKLRGALATFGADDELTALANGVDRLDFDAALAALDTLVAQIDFGTDGTNGSDR